MAHATTTAPPQGRVETQPHEISGSGVLDLVQTRPAPPKTDYGHELSRAAKSIFWQCRKGLYPVVVCGGLALVANGMHESATEPGYVLGGAVALTAGGFAITKVRDWIGKALWRKNWTAGALGLATVWTTSAVEHGVGMDSPLPTLLVVGGTAMAAPWWWFNRPRPSAVPVPVLAAIEAAAVEPPPAIEAGPHPDVIIWNDKMAPKVLKKSFILNREAIVDPKGKPNGSAWIVDGSEEMITSGEMFAQLEKIKAAYDRDFSDSLIYIEGSPSGRKTQSRLILLERNPLSDVVRWEEPKLNRETGVMDMAVYPDGSGWAPYVMFKPKWGPTHDLFAGGTGSGKTTAMKQVAIESMAMGNAVLLFDPHAGAEFEDSINYFTETFLTEAEIFVGMFGLEAVLDERMKMIAEIGKSNFGPDHGFPIIHAMLDEATMPLKNREINRIVVRIVTEGRKAWLKMSLALQVPSVDNLGDGGMTIREQLTSGNTLLYRITQRITGAMAYQGDLPVAPTSLPEFFDSDPRKPTVGLGYVLNGLGRALQSRSMLVTDEMFARWIQRIPQMDPRSAEAFRRGLNKGMAKLAELNPNVVLDDHEELGNVTQLRQPAPFAAEAAKVLEYIQARGGDVQIAEIIGAALCGAGAVGVVLAALTDGGQVRHTDQGYRAVS